MRKKAVDIPPIKFHWQNGIEKDGTSTIEWTVPPDRRTGMGSGLARFLNYEKRSTNKPYRGVVTIAIKDWIYEFKGMCFYREGDRPLKEEHEDIKNYLAEKWDLEGVAIRQRPDGRVTTKRYRKREKKLVMEGGMLPKLKRGEVKIMDQSLQVQNGKMLVKIELSAFNSDGTVFDVNKKALALDQAAYTHLQGLFIGGVQTPLVDLGKTLAAAAAAPAA